VKIRALSDLHIEFFDFEPLDVEADVVVLAGDIFTEHQGLAWARRVFSRTRIIYVLGNHEFYDARYETVLETSRQEAARLGIDLLECNAVVIDGVRFLGTTLWTDFEIDEPSPGMPSFALWYANQNMADFRLIRYRGEFLTPDATREFHRESRRWLSARLAEPFDGKTVVVTHHLPHRRSIHKRFDRDPLNPAFASHLPDLVRSPVDLKNTVTPIAPVTTSQTERACFAIPEAMAPQISIRNSIRSSSRRSDDGTSLTVTEHEADAREWSDASANGPPRWRNSPRNASKSERVDRARCLSQCQR